MSDYLNPKAETTGGAGQLTEAAEVVILIENLERRDGDDLSLQFGQRPAQSRQVARVGENDQVRIAAKLRRAV